MIPNERTHECMTELAKALGNQLGKELVGIVHTVCVLGADGGSEVYFFTQGPDDFMSSPKNHLIMLNALTEWSIREIEEREGENDSTNTAA